MLKTNKKSIFIKKNNEKHASHFLKSKFVRFECKIKVLQFSLNPEWQTFCHRPFQSGNKSGFHFRLLFVVSFSMVYYYYIISFLQYYFVGKLCFLTIPDMCNHFFTATAFQIVRIKVNDVY